MCPEKKLTKGILELYRLPRGEKVFAISHKDKVLSLSKFLENLAIVKNYHDLTSKRPYQPKKSRSENHFYAKVDTTLLLLQLS